MLVGPATVYLHPGVLVPERNSNSATTEPFRDIVRLPVWGMLKCGSSETVRQPVSVLAAELATR